jgi:hypothetical protein
VTHQNLPGIYRVGNELLVPRLPRVRRAPRSKITSAYPFPTTGSAILHQSPALRRASLSFQRRQ